MRVKRLVLKNFRNYKDLSWNPHPRLNIISGDNAQGKTNLLEAVFFCTAGRSFRTFKDREMINWQEEEAFARAEIERENTSLEITGLINNKEKTQFKQNGSRQQKGKIFNPVLAISFTPADLDFIRGSPSLPRWIPLP